MFSSHLLVLLLHCYLGVSSARTAKRSSRSAPDARGPLASPAHAFSGTSEDRDAVTQHMLRLYERYNREPRLKDGNTVRGVRAADRDAAEQREVYGLNLTTLQDSEVILAASLHFQLQRRPRPKPAACKRFRSSPACQHPPAIRILLRAASPGSGVGLGSSPGPLLANLTFHPHRRAEVWQMRDLTPAVKEARRKGHSLLSLELDLGLHRRRQPEEALSAGGGSPPYLLLYADDRALAEPNSVASGLQRYDPLVAAEEEEGRRPPRVPESPPRARREATAAGILRDNELPLDDYRLHGHSDKEGQLDSTWYLALRSESQLRAREERRKLERAEQAGAPERAGDRIASERVATAAPKEEGGNKRGAHASDSSATKRPGHRDGDRDGAKGAGEETRRNKEEKEEEKRQRGRSGGETPAPAQSPELSFDERTMRKARRRQWGQSAQAGCSRRNLRVDFADIGWSEWVIAPKAFEAYYCSGTCGFPLPKVTRPSNHATIQSIVRAVGIVPGVPAPCCVPDKMGPLAVLYRDEAGNPVLKVYPNMSVQSCSCR